MKIANIINQKSIYLDIKAGSKRQLLQELAEKASALCGIDERTIFDALLERENLGTTGFGGGTALPHARLENLDKIYGIFMRLSSPMNYEAIDNKPIDLVFMLISPDSSGADHLTALAQISRLLKDENSCEKLRRAKNEDEAYAVLSE